MTRPPIVAGQFYEDDFGELDHQITGCFEEKLGPGVTPGKRKDRVIQGLIAPHAGYFFSGSCAAWGYKELGESAFPDAYILLGLSHQGFKSCISAEDWVTPFGTVRNHSLLGERIAKETGLPIDERPHRKEHSIEVQIPFLQFISKDHLHQLRIVPIIISGDIDPVVAGKKIKQAVQGKQVIFIASSDLTHYGPNFGYVPFTDDIKENLTELDGRAIKAIMDHDPDGFKDMIRQTGATICGQNPILALLGALPDSKVKKLMYYSSGEISKDYENAVGYASLLFT
jgi:AmmeMemoRadiSam system protein B